MNSEWQKLLTAHGLKADGEGLSFPGSADAKDVMCPLLSDVVLHVTGDDAEASVQAQFSNDISALATPGSQLTTWSSPKGRVITLLRVIKLADGYLLKLPAALLDPVLKRLRMHMSLPIEIPGTGTLLKRSRMAKVTIEPRDDLLVAGVSGEACAEALSGIGLTLPAQTDDTIELSKGGWITRVRGEASRFEIIADGNQMAQYWSTLSQTGEAAAETAWRLQNIDSGVPSINAATTEAFVLQMLNLQHINGVSFKKGCFPGQEVVARMQYLGKLKRQMYRLQHTGEALPAAGDEIYIAGRDSAVGKVVDAVSVDGNSCRLLAVMAIAETAEKLYLDKEGKAPLELLGLPYETPVAD